jgi:hypothetical protein
VIGTIEWRTAHHLVHGTHAAASGDTADAFREAG